MKKIKQILLPLLLLGIHLQLNAQIEGELPRSENVTLTKSDPYPVIDGKKYYFTDNEGGVLAVKLTGRGNNEFHFQKFAGERLNQTKVKLETMDMPGFNFEYFVEIDDKLFLFYSIYDKPNLSEQFFAREINLEEGGFDGKGQLLVKTNKKLAAGYYSGYSAQGKFQLDVSDDESTFMVKYRYPPLDRDDSKNKDILGVSVFNSNLEKLWENDLTMPYLESKMNNLDFTIGSDGKVYFFIKKFKEEVTRLNAKDPDNESYAFLIADQDGEITETAFKLKDEYVIEDVSIIENASKSILCAGYYRKRDSHGADGAYIVILDRQGNLEEPKYYEFPLEFITKYRRLSERGKRKAEEKEGEDELALNNLCMSHISTLTDGSLVISGEIYYVTSYTDSKGNTRYTYHYDDVVLVKINPDGELGWLQRLPKKSTVESFRLMTSPNFVYVLFSDNPNNSTLPDDQNPLMGGGASRQVITWKIDKNTGEREYLPLFGFREIDGTPVYQYELGRVIGLSENSFAVEMYIKQKSDMMFKVVFEE